ncbi:pseudouridine synthase [Endothiovibrio diazotrophicus]
MAAPPILYRDEWLVAVDKPSGLLVHRSEIDRRETRFAVQLVRDRLGRRVYPAHRLDKPTSGLLLFALSPEIAARLGAAFSAGRVSKRYLAVVRGWCDEGGRVDHPLKDLPDGVSEYRRNGERAPLAALTDYRRLATVELPYAVDRFPSSRYSLLELTPSTGRKHQLRRHLKHLSHPIIGDVRYGKGPHNRLFAEALGCRRLLLHALELRLEHPVSGEPLVLRAPLSGCFRAVVERLGWAEVVGPQVKGER